VNVLWQNFRRCGNYDKRGNSDRSCAKRYLGVIWARKFRMSIGRNLFSTAFKRSDLMYRVLLSNLGEFYYKKQNVGMLHIY
jgi:hypothetical protein